MHIPTVIAIAHIRTLIALNLVEIQVEGHLGDGGGGVLAVVALVGSVVAVL